MVLAKHNPKFIELIDSEKIVACKDNPRSHPKSQLRAIAKSIDQYGFVKPILVTKEGVIVAGHALYEAAKILKLSKIPVIYLEHLTDAEVKAYRLADNQLATLSNWNPELLQKEIENIMELDVDFDLECTGFEIPEIDKILDLVIEEEPEQQEAPIPEPPPNPITQRGDLYQLGPHRLYCGDSTDQGSYFILMDGKQAQMIFTDPPYNVPISGHVSGLGAVQHDEFVMASGEMSYKEFNKFLKRVYKYLREFSADGSIHFVCMDWRHIAEAIHAGKQIFAELKNLCVWNKSNGGMGTFYRSKHELVMVFKNGTEAHINNFELGQHGRYRTNVWDYAGMNSITPESQELLAMHPTVKPVQMISDAILDCSKPNGIILDPFMGSGSTIMAAEKTGRHAYGIEYEPKYIDVTIQRWEAETGLKAEKIESYDVCAHPERN